MVMEILDKYYNLKEPTAFTSIVPITKSLNNKFTTEKVRSVLSKELAYSLHRPRRYKFKRLRNVGTGFWYDAHFDLGDFQPFSNENKGNKYILIGVDVVSRQIRAVPVRSKHSENMIIAFDTILKQIPVQLRSAYSDNGREFTSKAMMDYFKSKEILKTSSKAAEIKASLAERALRTLKDRLYAYFESQGSKKWIDVLPKLVEAINNSENRTIGVAPSTINLKNWFKIWRKHHSAKNNTIKGKSFLKLGDSVRLALHRSIIEKVLKTRKKDGRTQHYVKWKDLPSKNNSWVDQ